MEQLKGIQLDKILGREPYQDLCDLTSREEILIIGGKGSIGQRLAERCKNAVVTDIDELDVRYRKSVEDWQRFGFKYVINLAGDKHAPEGEVTPIKTLATNTLGTYNVIHGLPEAHHVLASTCKANNPETVYGSTKLIAERIALNAGQTVARFFNVVETSGNVFEIWKKGGQEVYDCQRYFISLDEAVGLLISCLSLKGRWAVNPGDIRPMTSIARLYHITRLSERRRGDRAIELLHSTSETVDRVNNLLHITSYHDNP